jgi:hypothetical protein
MRNQSVASYQLHCLLSCLASLLVPFFFLFDTGSRPDISPSQKSKKNLLAWLNPSGPSFLHSGYALSVCPDFSSYGVPDLLS